MPTSTDTERAPGAPSFVKALTLTDAVMLATGSMIGSGIFIVSAGIARTTGAPGWVLLAWIVTGAMTLLGALAYGELAAMFPRAGGQYVYLRESLGPLAGFLYGWTLFTVIQTGTIAAVAVAFGRFLGVVFPAHVSETIWTSLPHWSVQTPGGPIEVGLSSARVAGLVTIWLLTFVNLRGVREAKWVQTTLTIVKVAALAALIVLGLTIGRDAGAIAENFAVDRMFAIPAGTGAGAFIVLFAAGMVGSLFSSDAWNNVTFAAAEVQDPRRNLPRALVIGTGLVTLLYVAANVAYFRALPFDALAHAPNDRVGVAVADRIFGASGAVIMACAILVSTFGCNNGLILSGARVSYAMANDRLFFARLGRLNSGGVPGAALVAQAAWTSVLCLTGTYAQLLDYVVFAALAFYALTTLGLFVLRARRPDAERPYRAIGYPVLPAIYLVLATAVAVLLLFADKTRTQAASGFVVVLVGIPVFLLWRRRASAAL